MSNPFKRTFTLCQHTPVIHFQHDQAGATLRATELKPKLDRFLIKNVFKADFDVYKKYLIGYSRKEEEKYGDQYKKQFDGKLAFDYKVKIEGNYGKAEEIEIKYRKRDGSEGENSFPLFFGNLENEQERRSSDKKYQFKLAKAEFNLEIFSLHPDLLTAIKKRFSEFIFKTNFGTRQSKGFGSFEAAIKGVKYDPAGIPNFSVKTDDKTILFRTVELFYKSLRGGINGFSNLRSGRYEGDYYMKPFIFAYAKQNNIQWDKKTVKANFFSNVLEEEIDRHSKQDKAGQLIAPDVLSYQSEQVFDVKDLLGLSTLEQWKLPDHRGRYTRSTMIKKESVSNEIDRFQSPITFKPVKVNNGYQVYVLLREIPKDFLNTAIKFSNNRDDFTIPVWKDFSIRRFLDFVLNYDVDRLIPNMNNRSHPFAQEIKRIIRELKSSL